MSGDRDDAEDDPFLPEDILEIPAEMDVMEAARRLDAGQRFITVRTSKGHAILKLNGDLQDKALIMRRIDAFKRHVTGATGQRIKSEIAVADQAARRDPPKIAEFCLALFLSKARGEAMIGDLSERFDQDCQQLGAERARRIYWGRTAKSLWPLLRRGAARAFKWGVVVASVRRFF